jgi:phage gpG-like protein
MPFSISISGVDKLNKKVSDMREARRRLTERLLQASNDFGNATLTTIRSKYLQGPRPEKLGVGTGNLKSKIRFTAKKNGSDILITFGTDVPYAAIHEFGGETNPKVSQRMRKWAWFMFYKTKNDMFRRIALTKKDQFRIKVKKRPFLRPGIEDGMPKFQEQIKSLLARAAEGSIG